MKLTPSGVLLIGTLWAIAPLADTISVNVPLKVKAMRSEVSHVRVNCTLWYTNSEGERKYRSALSPFTALDSFGNLSRDMNVTIDTSDISPQHVHAPDSQLQCTARLYGSESESNLLITEGFTWPNTDRSSLLDESASRLVVVEKNLVPDPPSEFDFNFQRRSDDQNRIRNEPRSLRIR